MPLVVPDQWILAGFYIYTYIYIYIYIFFSSLITHLGLEDAHLDIVMSNVDVDGVVCYINLIMFENF